MDFWDDDGDLSYISKFENESLALQQFLRLRRERSVGSKGKGHTGSAPTKTRREEPSFREFSADLHSRSLALASRDSSSEFGNEPEGSLREFLKSSLSEKMDTAKIIETQAKELQRLKDAAALANSSAAVAKSGLSSIRKAFLCQTLASTIRKTVTVNTCKAFFKWKSKTSVLRNYSFSVKQLRVVLLRHSSKIRQRLSLAFSRWRMESVRVVTRNLHQTEAARRVKMKWRYAQLQLFSTWRLEALRSAMLRNLVLRTIRLKYRFYLRSAFSRWTRFLRLERFHEMEESSQVSIRKIAITKLQFLGSNVRHRHALELLQMRQAWYKWNETVKLHRIWSKKLSAAIEKTLLVLYRRSSPLSYAFQHWRRFATVVYPKTRELFQKAINQWQLCTQNALQKCFHKWKRASLVSRYCDDVQSRNSQADVQVALIKWITKSRCIREVQRAKHAAFVICRVDNIWHRFWNKKLFKYFHRWEKLISHTVVIHHTSKKLQAMLDQLEEHTQEKEAVHRTLADERSRISALHDEHVSVLQSISENLCRKNSLVCGSLLRRMNSKRVQRRFFQWADLIRREKARQEFAVQCCRSVIKKWKARVLQRGWRKWREVLRWLVARENALRVRVLQAMQKKLRQAFQMLNLHRFETQLRCLRENAQTKMIRNVLLRGFQRKLGNYFNRWKFGPNLVHEQQMRARFVYGFIRNKSLHRGFNSWKYFLRESNRVRKERLAIHFHFWRRFWQSSRHEAAGLSVLLEKVSQRRLQTAFRCWRELAGRLRTAIKVVTRWLDVYSHSQRGAVFSAFKRWTRFVLAGHRYSFETLLVKHHTSLERIAALEEKLRSTQAALLEASEANKKYQKRCSRIEVLTKRLHLQVRRLLVNGRTIGMLRRCFQVWKFSVKHRQHSRLSVALPISRLAHAIEMRLKSRAFAKFRRNSDHHDKMRRTLAILQNKQLALSARSTFTAWKRWTTARVAERKESEWQQRLHDNQMLARVEAENKIKTRVLKKMIQCYESQAGRSLHKDVSGAFHKWVEHALRKRNFFLIAFGSWFRRWLLFSHHEAFKRLQQQRLLRGMVVRRFQSKLLSGMKRWKEAVRLMIEKERQLRSFQQSIHLRFRAGRKKLLQLAFSKIRQCSVARFHYSVRLNSLLITKFKGCCRSAFLRWKRVIKHTRLMSMTINKMIQCHELGTGISLKLCFGKWIRTVKLCAAVESLAARQVQERASKLYARHSFAVWKRLAGEGVLQERRRTERWASFLLSAQEEINDLFDKSLDVATRYLRELNVSAILEESQSRVSSENGVLDLERLLVCTAESLRSMSRNKLNCDLLIVPPREISLTNTADSESPASKPRLFGFDSSRKQTSPNSERILRFVSFGVGAIGLCASSGHCRKCGRVLCIPLVYNGSVVGVVQLVMQSIDSLNTAASTFDDDASVEPIDDFVQATTSLASISGLDVDSTMRMVAMILLLPMLVGKFLENWMLCRSTSFHVRTTLLQQKSSWEQLSEDMHQKHLAIVNDLHVQLEQLVAARESLETERDALQLRVGHLQRTREKVIKLADESSKQVQWLQEKLNGVQLDNSKLRRDVKAKETELRNFRKQHEDIQRLHRSLSVAESFMMNGTTNNNPNTDDALSHSIHSVGLGTTGSGSPRRETFRFESVPGSFSPVTSSTRSTDRKESSRRFTMGDIIEGSSESSFER